MVHSKQYVVEYLLFVVAHRLGQIHVSELVTYKLGNCAFLHKNNE